MEIIELLVAPVPFNREELEKDTYLPVSIFDELGNYYTLVEGKIYKTNEEILISSVKQIFESNPKAKFPQSVQSMAKGRYNEMEKLMKAVPHFQEHPPCLRAAGCSPAAWHSARGRQGSPHRGHLPVQAHPAFHRTLPHWSRRWLTERRAVLRLSTAPLVRHSPQAARQG